MVLAAGTTMVGGYQYPVKTTVLNSLAKPVAGMSTVTKVFIQGGSLEASYKESATICVCKVRKVRCPSHHLGFLGILCILQGHDLPHSSSEILLADNVAERCF